MKPKPLLYAHSSYFEDEGNRARAGWPVREPGKHSSALVPVGNKKCMADLLTVQSLNRSSSRLGYCVEPPVLSLSCCPLMISLSSSVTSVFQHSFSAPLDVTVMDQRSIVVLKRYSTGRMQGSIACADHRIYGRKRAADHSSRTDADMSSTLYPWLAFRMAVVDIVY